MTTRIPAPAPDRGSVSYRLRAQSRTSLDLLTLFEQATFAFSPATSGQRATPAEWSITLALDVDELEVVIPSSAPAPPPELIDTARSIVSQIVELDEMVTVEINETVDDGYLVGIRIAHPSEAHLMYFAAHVNSEWDEVVVRHDGGPWIYRGVRDPRSED